MQKQMSPNTNNTQTLLNNMIPLFSSLLSVEASPLMKVGALILPLDSQKDPNTAAQHGRFVRIMPRKPPISESTVKTRSLLKAKGYCVGVLQKDGLG